MKSLFISLLLIEMLTWAGNGHSKTRFMEEESNILSKEEKYLRALEKKKESLVKMVEEETRDIEWMRERKVSALHWAVYSGSEELVKYILGQMKKKNNLPRLLDYLTYKIEGPVLLTSLQHKSWWRMKDGENRVMSVSWSPDGSKICTGSADKTARIWNRNGEKGSSLQNADGGLAVSWSP